MNAFSPYTSISTEEALTRLKSSVRGLTPERAAERLAEEGLNRVRSHETTPLRIFARQFKSSFVYLLIAAAAIAFGLGEWINGILILLFVLLNAGLGFYQEARSHHTLALLGQYLMPTSRVRRGGRDLVISSELLVPGDIITIEAGDHVPADARLRSAQALRVDESVLTGESVPMQKNAESVRETDAIHEAMNIIFSGTSVVAGRGEAIVIATGARAVFGTVATLASETARASTFEKSINRLSAFTLRLVGITLLGTFLLNLFLKRGDIDVPGLLIFSIALAVSVIPEALPTVMTFSLSRGALRLSRNKVVVKRLSAIEDLGSIDVLCCDKTGTLTEHKLRVVETRAEHAANMLFLAACAGTYVGKDRVPKDPFDAAIADAISSDERVRVRLTERLAEIPFDPERRRNSGLVRVDGTATLIVRGALETMLTCCLALDADARVEWIKWAQGQGRQGRRVLAVACKSFDGTSYAPEEEEQGMELLGCIAFEDPIKHTARDTVRKAERLGVRLKILTGDSPEVAGAIAFQAGIISSPEEVMTGESLDTLAASAQHDAVWRFDVFARVSPAQKYAIIRLLQETSSVGFLGEGINDAPALKAADVGIVVAGAADVAREASDIVLMKKSLDVIVDGIKEGREVFVNTLKYVQTTLTANFGNFYALAISTLFIRELPMLPLQILLVNLLSDFPMIAIATDRVDPDEIKGPRRYDVGRLAFFATILGLVSTAFDFAYFAMFVSEAPSVLQTNWFIGSILTELALIYSLRSRFLCVRASRPSTALIGLSIMAAVVTIALPYTGTGARLFGFTPPSPAHLALILGLAVTYFLVTELVKLLTYRFLPSKPYEPSLSR